MIRDIPYLTTETETKIATATATIHVTAVRAHSMMTTTMIADLVATVPHRLGCHGCLISSTDDRGGCDTAPEPHTSIHIMGGN
jgi:hypothetical protein